MQRFELPAGGRTPDALQFSPDGRRLAVQSDSRLDVIDLPTGSSFGVYSFAAGRAWSSWRLAAAKAGFTPDGREVVYLQRETGQLVARDLATAAGRTLYPCEDGVHRFMTAVAVHSSGASAFVGTPPEPTAAEVVAVDTVAGGPRAAFGRHRGRIRELAVSADGRWVAGCSGDAVRVWRVGGPKPPTRAHWQAAGGGAVALTADGGHLAAGGGGERFRIWDLRNREELDLDRSPVVGHRTAFAPDRPLLAYTRGTDDVGMVVFWDVRGRAEVRRYNWGVGGVRAVAFSNDGTMCATASKTSVVVWDVDV